MLVYVINKDGQPLMPTSRCGWVRRALKSGRAEVVNRCPFTIQLAYESTTHTQPVSLGVDAGSKHIGLSATTEDKVLYEADVTLRNDIVDLLSTRRQNRRTRRSRKTRYRQPRFSNRVHSKNKGWLAPSIEQKIQTHLTVIRKTCSILPVTDITIEAAAFDTQLLKAQDYGLEIPEGTDYQNGDMKGYNTREYVLFRDGHKCRCCKGKSKDPVLQVHHIQSRKTGGNAPNNLVTLCRTCHEGYHKGRVTLPEDISRGNRYNDAAFMGIMRWTVYNRLKALYPEVTLTYGYITKDTRIRCGLPKDHYIDARCISGHPMAEPLGYVYYQKKVRCHNRQIHKGGISKGGCRKLNQAPKVVKGFKLFDIVNAKGTEWYVHGRRMKGSFVLKEQDGSTLETMPSKITLIKHQQSYITERRPA